MMRQLTELGIAHQSTAVGPGKTLAVFPTVAARDFALNLLTGAGFDASVSGGRGLLAVAPTRAMLRRNEPLIKRYAGRVMVLVFIPWPLLVMYGLWRLRKRYRASHPAPVPPVRPGWLYGPQHTDSRLWRPAPPARFYAGSRTPRRHRKV